MAASGYTPIQLYRTATASAAPVAGNLTNGELAINYNAADMALYAKNGAGTVVRLINNPAGLKYPTSDGTSGQVLVTNGAGVLSWSSSPTGFITGTGTTNYLARFNGSSSVTTSSIFDNGTYVGISTSAVLGAAGTDITVLNSSVSANASVGAAGQVLTSRGANLSPQWTSPNVSSGTSILYGNGSGGFSNVTIGSGVSFAGGTLSATGSGGTVTAVTATSPLASTGGNTPDISLPAATSTVSGYLTSTDWNTFNNKQPAGSYLTTVTADSPLTGSGTSASHLSIPAASASVSGYLTSADWNTFNSKGSGTVTAVSVASTNGFAGTSSGGATPQLTLSTTVTGLLKGNGTAISAATSGTDYAPATSGSSILYGNGSGGFSNVTVGSGLSFTGGTLSATAGGGGTVTSVSVVSANGFAGTVATATSTPAITISTSVTGLLKGNGTAISAATSGTDYAPATTGSSILYGNGAGGFSNVTIGSGVSFAGGTLSATGSGGTVTSVAALTLGTTGTDLSSTVANGTTTPVITLNVPTASATNRGALSSTDWSTFNGKIGGSGTTNYVPKFSSSTALSNSVIYDDGTNVGIGTSSPTTKLTIAGTTSVFAVKTPNILETATVSATAATGTINYDLTTQSVLYYTTAASANWTVNFRASSGTSLNTALAVGESITAVFLVTQGATAYYNNAVQIDGTSVTPKWQGGTAPTSGNASSIDVYTYSIIKTASATFTVLASQTKFA